MALRKYLVDKVVNLGNLGEVVKVKDGYAGNFLIPSGRARRVPEANKAEFERKRVQIRELNNFANYNDGSIANR